MGRAAVSGPPIAYDHRLMRPLCVLVAALVLVPGAAAASHHTSVQQSLLGRINAVRQTHGLPPLTVSPQLLAAARAHTEDMSRFGYFSHDSRDGRPFWQRLEQRYPPSGHGSWAVGENILWWSPNVSPLTAVEVWMRSPSHRANLLDPAWRQVGIGALHASSAPGIYGGQPVTILTVDFGARG